MTVSKKVIGEPLTGLGSKRMAAKLRRTAPIVLLGHILLSCAGGNTPAPGPVCCRLEGKWSVALQLDAAEIYGGIQPGGRKAHGTITFSQRYPVPWANERSSSDFQIEGDSAMSVRADTLRWEGGRYDIDFSAFWSGTLAPEPSFTVLPGGEDALAEAVALFIRSDSLIIILNPRVTHGGVALVGALMADSMIRGRWGLGGNESQAAGRFEMRRTRGP